MKKLVLAFVALISLCLFAAAQAEPRHGGHGGGSHGGPPPRHDYGYRPSYNIYVRPTPVVPRYYYYSYPPYYYDYDYYYAYPRSGFMFDLRIR